MSVVESPVLFQSGQNELMGILHAPQTSAQPEIAVLFVHSGARGRLGSTFQYPLAARALAAKGIPCMRWDPNGMGDSEGFIEDMKMLDFFGSIQAGRFVGDTLAAIDEIERQVRPKKLVLWGLCGGAITSLLAAPRAGRRVDGLVLLSTPVLLDSAQQSPLERISAEHATSYLWSLYGKKLLSVEAWKRLLSMQSDIETMKTYGAAAVKGFARKVREKIEQRLRPRASEEPQKPRNPRANPHYFEAMDAMLRRQTKMLMLYGETDALRYDFWNEYYEPILKKNETYARLCEVHLIAGCNHLFTLREWQRQALDLAMRWLRTV
jgi:pimeloyl-ACP methyl ester carboxylesterase